MNITDQLLLSLLNLKEDDISNIASVSRDNIVSYYVTLNRPVIQKCPVCGKDSIESNGYYPKKVILTGKPFNTGTVFLKVPRYKCLIAIVPSHWTNISLLRSLPFPMT